MQYLARAVRLAAIVAAYLILPPPALDRSRLLSVLVLARDGSVLRGFLTCDGKWRLPVRPEQVDPLYRKMLIAAEDRHFAAHPGVDPLAVLRAFGQFVGRGHVVSGASTLTMQTVRLLERRPRSLPAKLIEMGGRWAWSGASPKTIILGLYLTLAPFGGNLEVRAASLTYFGEPRQYRRPKRRCWWHCRARRSSCGRPASRGGTSGARRRAGLDAFQG